MIHASAKTVIDIMPHSRDRSLLVSSNLTQPIRLLELLTPSTADYATNLVDRWRLCDQVSTWSGTLLQVNLLCMHQIMQ